MNRVFYLYVTKFQSAPTKVVFKRYVSRKAKMNTKTYKNPSEASLKRLAKAMEKDKGSLHIHISPQSYMIHLFPAN